ncbi:MAG: bifunctional phosphopantothenoylcysteine decarboxylase/phosphopantothenate--cysteine ligase CoaBC [Flavobacteriales bacterium]|nr:bifunctional phosphopantothenoylcysteine decarboxylase/phosphopantothenate--cysteine ligase CoaBC [Flavobacteriales bacterium]
MSMRFPRRVLLGVTGGIAAYKAAFLVRELVQAGADVRVVMTRSARDFVTPLTLATLSKNPVLTELVDRISGEPRWNDHVALAEWADIMLVAPATANTLAKMAQGLCDELLLACYLSARCPVFVAPAMDLEMYRDAATQFNIARLKEHGVNIIGPASGELASGLFGEGRMSEPGEILQHLVDAVVDQGPLAGKRVLVTAGPTHEPIDPVRFIGNRSSGRMGFAIAEEAAGRGALVHLVTGPVELGLDRPGVTRTDVGTAAEMAEVCKQLFPAMDLVIMSAAVADLRPSSSAAKKIKKEGAPEVLQLERTEDILAWMGSNKTQDQVLVGFALETEQALDHAREKMARKALDLIVVNTLEDHGAGFGHDTNKVVLLRSDNTMTDLPLMPKTDVARRLLDTLEEFI